MLCLLNEQEKGNIMNMKFRAQREPLPAIRLHCLGCVEGIKAVDECSIKDCSLWPFRYGVRPSTAKKRNRNVCFEQIQE